MVIKRLPTLECADCAELSIEDPIMEKVESLLEQTDESTELAVITYPDVRWRSEWGDPMNIFHKSTLPAKRPITGRFYRTAMSAERRPACGMW